MAISSFSTRKTKEKRKMKNEKLKIDLIRSIISIISVKKYFWQKVSALK
jgi:hypothetical protein